MRKERITSDMLPCHVSFTDPYLSIANGKICEATKLRSVLDTDDLLRVEVPLDDGGTHICWVPTYIVKVVR